MDLGDAAPTRQVLVNGAPVGVTTLFPMGSTTVVFRFHDASGNAASASSTVTVTARIVDAPTIVQTTAVGGARLKFAAESRWRMVVRSRQQRVRRPRTGRA